MEGPHLPLGFDSGLEDLFCDPSLLYGTEMTAFSFDDEAMLWDVDSPNGTVSSGGAKLQSHHASAGGSSRSPTGSSLIFTPTSTQLDFQDADGFVDAELEGTSPVSNNNTSEDYVHVHSFDGVSNRGNQRYSARTVRNSRPNEQPLFQLESPHSHTASELPNQLRQPSFTSTSTSSFSMSDNSDQGQPFTLADMELYHRTSNELLSNVGGFDIPIAGPSYRGAGLPLRPSHHGDASRTSHGNMAILSQQMSNPPFTAPNMMGYMGNNSFLQYNSLSANHVTPAPLQESAGPLNREALYAQYLRSMSQNAAHSPNEFYSPAALQSQNLTYHQNGSHATDAFYQQQVLHPAKNVRSTPSTRALNINQPTTSQALQPRTKRSTTQQETSQRVAASNARDHADRVRKGGRSRNSHLSEKSREKSSVMRKVGACWRCAMQRDPVGEHWNEIESSH